MSDKPNCPLETYLRPCMCPDMPRCPECGYTQHDADAEGDHHLCGGAIPEKALPMKSTLLPCPFCGCKDHRWGNQGEHIQDGYEVYCDGCHAEMWGQTREEAEKNWNARPVVRQAPTERDLLKKMAAHGGEFARALAAAWMLADPHNAACLRASFGGMLARYEGAPDPDNCGIPRAFNGGDQT